MSSLWFHYRLSFGGIVKFYIWSCVWFNIPSKWNFGRCLCSFFCCSGYIFRETNYVPCVETIMNYVSHKYFRNNFRRKGGINFEHLSCECVHVFTMCMDWTFFFLKVVHKIVVNHGKWSETITHVDFYFIIVAVI